jgi:hypothetical protein
VRCSCRILTPLVESCGRLKAVAAPTSCLEMLHPALAAGPPRRSGTGPVGAISVRFESRVAPQRRQAPWPHHHLHASLGSMTCTAFDPSACAVGRSHPEPVSAFQRRHLTRKTRREAGISACRMERQDLGDLAAASASGENHLPRPSRVTVNPDPNLTERK